MFFLHEYGNSILVFTELFEYEIVGEWVKLLDPAHSYLVFEFLFLAQFINGDSHFAAAEYELLYAFGVFRGDAVFWMNSEDIEISPIEC